MDLRSYLQEKKRLVDHALERYVPSSDGHASTIYKAMRYSLFAGGKRLRPILTIASSEAVGGYTDSVLPFACAIELIHTYSLIHDDLPAMDDDDYRRGNLTNHKVYGEAAAILAGDALLTEAFRLMTDSNTISGVDPNTVLNVINDIADAAGASGMVGGQMVDIELEGKQVDIYDVEYIHTHKTGALIASSVRIGARLGGGTKEEVGLLSMYGSAIGLAFQTVDDILNVEGDEALLGKSVGSDANKKKATYPAVLGLDDSKETADELIDKAIGYLRQFDDKAEPLRMIARYIGKRKA
ncbi:MAG: polyprenyl synthetase family protein [Deltaproteobacteria bacterium]|nr:MAG: polyprenyl synthetase family protein [Deltaproteobacteria bacterium]